MDGSNLLHRLPRIPVGVDNPYATFILSNRFLLVGFNLSFQCLDLFFG